MNRKKLESFVGKEIVIYCCRYIYAGKVVEIDDFSLELTDCGIVYVTGSHNDSEWEAYEKIKKNHHIALQSIESYGEFK
jgi:hypothetical protein